MKSQTSFINFNITVIVSVLSLIFVAFLSIGYAQSNKPITDNSQKTKDSQDDVIRVDSNLVTVPATVFDREGRYMTNLKKEDFQVFENGIEQDVAFYEPVDKPFTVFLLFDRSGSMSNKMAELARAGNAFVSQLRPDDQITIATFADNVDVLVKPIKVSNLKKGIKLRQHFGDHFTYLYDAVEDTFKRIAKIPGRKAIILFSDGNGDGTYATLKSNLRDAEELDALIYTVQFNTHSAIPPTYVNKKTFYESIEVAKKYMVDLAQITGGRHYQIEDVVDLERTFGLIAEELGRQYSLGYYPKQTAKEGERRQIKVKMRQPNLIVRARDSYIIGSAKNKQK